jgi:hypothetical protein
MRLTSVLDVMPDPIRHPLQHRKTWIADQVRNDKGSSPNQFINKNFLESLHVA